MSRYKKGDFVAWIELGGCCVAMVTDEEWFHSCYGRKGGMWYEDYFYEEDALYATVDEVARYLEEVGEDNVIEDGHLYRMRLEKVGGHYRATFSRRWVKTMWEKAKKKVEWWMQPQWKRVVARDKDKLPF